MRIVKLLVSILLVSTLILGCNRKGKEGCPAEQAYQAAQNAGPGQQQKPAKVKSGAWPTDGQGVKYSKFKKKNNKRKRS
jgi:hypothetical protein